MKTQHTLQAELDLKSFSQYVANTIFKGAIRHGFGLAFGL